MQCVALILLTLAIAVVSLLLLVMVVRRFRRASDGSPPRAAAPALVVSSGTAVHDVDDLAAWLRENPRATVLFYASWCNHCHAMLPEYDKAAEQAPTATLGRVQCDNQQELVSSYKLRGFPTVLRFENGEVIQQYSGDRSASDLARFVA